MKKQEFEELSFNLARQTCEFFSGKIKDQKELDLIMSCLAFFSGLLKDYFTEDQDLC